MGKYTYILYIMVMVLLVNTLNSNSMLVRVNKTCYPNGLHGSRGITPLKGGTIQKSTRIYLEGNYYIKRFWYDARNFTVIKN